MDFFERNKQNVTYGVIALVAIAIGYALLHRKNTSAAAAQAASGTVDGQPAKQVVYIPTSESYIYENTTETNSNNTQPPITQTSHNNPPPVASPPHVVNPPPTTNPAPTPNPVPTPVTSPVSSAPSGNDPHAPVAKDPAFTAETAGGWWHNPNASNPWDNQWLERTGHYLDHGFASYYWAHGAGAVFGGPVSEEYRDSSSNAVRQDFENGTMFWQQGSDPANYDVKWIAKGAGGAYPTAPLQPHHMTQPSGPPQIPSPTHLAVTQQHTVQMGDTLTSIGARYGVNWQKIYRANQPAIDAASHAQGHPIPGGPWNNIVAGMKLGIPAG